VRACGAAIALASGQTRERLQKALDEAQRLRTARRDDDAAWALRRAFDAALAEPSPARSAAAKSAADPAPPIADAAAAAAAMQRAIRAGVPLFNGGDAAGCAALYEACCRSAAPALRGAAQERVSGALAQLPTLRCRHRRRCSGHAALPLANRAASPPTSTVTEPGPEILFLWAGQDRSG
jgi:hypothetical protein